MRTLLSLLLLLLCVAYTPAHAQSTADVIEKTLSGVVTVAVYKAEPLHVLLGFRGEASVSEQAYTRALDLSGARGSGSGFVIERGGKKYIITNAHVIQEASKDPGSIYVYSIDQTRYEVKIVGGDTFYDFAVLEFVTQPGKDIVALKYSSTEPRIGEKVYAIGNPLGDFPYSVSDGIISAKNRARGGLTGKFGFLQTTATLIWGNSGGPLVNEAGEVVGINSQIHFTESPAGGLLWQSQLNFALESKIASKLTDDILTNKGLVRRAYLGVEFSESSAYRNNSLVSDERGPVLTGLVPGSPAETRLRAMMGKRIIAVNQQPVRNLEEVLGELERVKPNTNVSLQFQGEAPINLSGQELSPRALEAIAGYVLGSLPNVEVDLNSPLPAIYLKNADNVYAYGGKKFQEKLAAPSQVRKYMILAGGIMDEHHPTMYATTKLSDIGAVLKLTGLSGVFDFCNVPEGGSESDVSINRYVLSSKEDVLKKTLWY
ncbi:S1C family serine protease [Cesiribacter andamanensis]|uniref:Periplasmic pH-dependent serine endoprotease DegQ n=1 Tax=Cesiribacter andamanensis AMV16 TaxID=1279009 RepID=M7N7J2_9BACT|nr:trypsin-like peptidase domain-containing protein [Cesiribacter andamanensis]EMR03217.1 Periplasmic pH-dependent serine endoprotease DegQ precursor [Cesiribacter andamanensis AMV16]